MQSMATVRNGKIVFEAELLRETRTELAQKNGMCEASCMNATEKVCRCYCNGLNHGIHNHEYQAEVAYGIPELVEVVAQ